MPWNNGQFTQLPGHDWVVDAANDIEILAAKVEARTDDIEAGVNNCLAKDGTNAATEDINLGGNKLINVAEGVADSHAVNVGQLNHSFTTIAPLGAINSINVAIIDKAHYYSGNQNVVDSAYGKLTPATIYNSPTTNNDTTDNNSPSGKAVMWRYFDNNSAQSVYYGLLGKYRGVMILSQSSTTSETVKEQWTWNGDTADYYPRGDFISVANVGIPLARIDRVYATNAYNQSSDESLKSNFVPIDGAEAWQFVQELQQLKGFTWYTLNADSNGLKHAGLSAQDCVAAAASVGWNTNDLAFIETDKNGILSLSYSELQIIFNAAIFWRLHNA